VSWEINNLTAPDFYTAASTLQNLPNISSVNIDNANSAIYWQVQQVTSRSGLWTEATWSDEKYMLPGSRSIYRAGIRGFRFRAAIPIANIVPPAMQSQVTIEAVD